WMVGEPLVVILEDDEQSMTMDHFMTKAEEEYVRIRATHLLPRPDSLYLSRQQISEQLAGRRQVLHRFFDSYKVQERRHVFSTQAPLPFNADTAKLTTQLQEWRTGGHRVWLVLRTPETCATLQKTIADHEIRGDRENAAEAVSDAPPRRVAANLVGESSSTGDVTFLTGMLSEGFLWKEAGLVWLNEREMLGRQIRRRRERETALDVGISFEDLEAGDYIVHVDHGIGRYLGVKRMVVEGVPRDFVELLYADDNRLFVPMDKLHFLQRYMAGKDYTPNLDKLGGTRWINTKARIKESVLLLAADLIKIYARREVARGRRFAPDTPMQREFELSFIYDETRDQLKAIDDVKRDMESNRPMDRMICGDVGFGKTEVAMRAAFKAVVEGTQVAVLAPTTVLCQQHFDTFSVRFRKFPVNVAMLSRFVDRNEQKDVLKDIAAGKVDIVIGTHRLLSTDLKFKELGLVVIDEEHRFGVRHKERLKEMRAAVEMLTLTATPIPRSLHMSLVGIRDMSMIHTAPEERLPIRTRVMRFDPETIQRVIRAELERDGQVYVVHNRVKSIETIAMMIRRLVPEATIEVGHGQMPESRLSSLMRRFGAHEFDVLVATTIIESGLDIPAVNTIIINRADMLGLAQLYQLRGRVGRDRYQAYAYLFVPGFNLISKEARKRLEAVAEAKELGAGFKLAMADLDIRGAGDLLGPRQHGHIAAVGFELYCRLMREAVMQVRGEVAEEIFEPSMRLPGVALLPDSYIPEGGQRLQFYRNLSAAADEDALSEIREELEDRYGALPSEATLLIRHMRLTQLARRLRIKKMEHARGCLTVQFDSDSRVDPGRVAEMVLNYPDQMRFKGEDRLLIDLDGDDAMAACEWLEDTMSAWAGSVAG
ncbi:transcription-repair coupling factor, partial [bacterium]|nr:transcription-repair coupling factor [candidate division CSSED10-310 bacterium]